MIGLAKNHSYFRNWRSTFAFGSRFDSIEALTEVAQLSSDALSWLLTLKYIPDPFSASDEIQKLPAGHILEIVGDKQTTTKWYHPQPDAAALSLSVPIQKQKLRSVLDQAVADRLISDVPIACFLSGGIDLQSLHHWLENTCKSTPLQPDLMKACLTSPKRHVKPQNI